MPYVKVLLDRDEEQALISLAEKQKRDAQQQAAYLIRRYLQMLRYLPGPETPATTPTPTRRHRGGGGGQGEGGAYVVC